MRALPALLAALLLGLAPAAAQDLGAILGGGQDAAEPAAPADGLVVPDGDIASSPEDTVADAEIEARLTGIFGALPSLQGVTLSVQSGVVSLSGTVPDAAAVTRAEVLASQTDGVVAVQNDLAEDVTVSGRLAPAAERARRIGQQAISLLPLLAVAAAVVLGFWLFGAFLARQKWLLRRVAKNELIAGLLGTVVPVVFFLLGLVVALNILDAVGVLSAVLGAAGVLGLAVGFAIRDTIENFIASVMLSLRQPFRPKDFVEIDGQAGAVVRLTSRATILMTPDGNHLRIPNAQVFKAVILNTSRNPERRFTFALGIDAEDDPRAGIEAGVAALEALSFVLADPAPRGWVEEVGDSNIVLTFAPWIDQTETDFLKAKSTAIRAVKITLEDQGFTLPEPIYRLRVDQVPATLAAQAPAQDASSKGAQQAVRTTKPRTGDLDGDTSPDRALEEKVEADRRAGSEDDLLNAEAPDEFGR